jgi:hypothetical protein
MVRTVAAALLGLILFCSGVMAAKAPAKKAAPPPEPPMQVVIVRSAAAGCEPSCPEWIAAQGKIEARTTARFKKIIKQLGPRKLPVFIHSGGGDMDASLAIGRLLREKGFDIAVARTAFVPCAPKDAACAKAKARNMMQGRPDDHLSICASACAFVLAAGDRRFVSPHAYVGVHQILLLQTFSKVMQTYKLTTVRSASGAPKVRKQLVSTKVIEKKVVPKKAPASVYDRVDKYFAEMGVGDGIMPLLQKTPNASVHWLSHEELRATKIATHRLDSEQLLAGITIPGDGWIMPTVDSFSASPAGVADCEKLGGLALACSADASQGAPGNGVIIPPLPSRSPSQSERKRR